MSNKIYEDKLYDEKKKISFIEQYAEGTQKIISRLFKVSQVVENELGKDVHDFNREELRKLFFLYMPKTNASSNSNVTWISKYIEWSIEKNYKRGLNPLDSVDSDWKKQFANNTIKRFWTDKEIGDIVNPTKRANHQDGIIVSLLFSGVRGSANSEITNLRKKDVDFNNNLLHLNDDNGKSRTIKANDMLLTLCQKALAETEYEKMNGNASPDIKSPMAQLVDNDYVVKSANTRTIHFEEADKNVVHRRLTKIADEIGEPHFTPLNIMRSGMLAVAKDIYLETGTLTDEDIQKISEQFGGDSENTEYRLKNDFLNIDTIKSLYQLP